MLNRINKSILLTNILIGFLSFHAPVLAQNKRFNCPNKTLETLVSTINENAIICRFENPTKLRSDITDLLHLYRQDEHGEPISLITIGFFKNGTRKVIITDTILSNVVKETSVSFLLYQRTFVKWLTPPNPAIVDKFSPDLKLILDIGEQPKYTF